jgi:spore germination protein (amino acid permease)
VISEGKIGVQEAICLVVIATGNRVFFTAPTVVSQAVGNAGWYMSVISNAVTLFSFTFIFLLLKRFPGKDILEIFKVAFGRILGFIFCMIYTGSFLAATGILMREFYEMLKTYVFPGTPISGLNAAMVLLVSATAYLGLEAIARAAKLTAMAALFGYIVLLLLSVQNYKLSNLFPMLGYGFGKTVWEGITRSSAFSEVIILAVFAGSLQGIRHIKKAGYLSILFSGLVISVGIFCLTLVFPYYSFQEQTAPLYALATLINYGAFFQRLDPAFLSIWIMITGISSSIVFYCAISSFCKTFGLQDKRPVIPPMAVLLFAITMIPPDLPSVISKYIEILRSYPIFLFYVLPLITLVTALLRKKKGGAYHC